MGTDATPTIEAAATRLPAQPKRAVREGSGSDVHRPRSPLRFVGDDKGEHLLGRGGAEAVAGTEEEEVQVAGPLSSPEIIGPVSRARSPPAWNKP